jgi:hypothetical protein
LDDKFIMFILSAALKIDNRKVKEITGARSLRFAKPEEVMDQGIAAAPQEAPSALAALPSNLPAEGMAGGGIVAFADGGELDIDDDEDEVT